MPQLAKLGEFDSYFHWRCNPGASQNWPARIWEGVDGTPLLAYSTSYGGCLQPESLAGNILNYLDFGLRHILHIWGLGDHGGGIPRYQLDLLELYRHKPLIPTVIHSTMAALAGATRGEKGKLRHNNGETYSLFEGCFTTHASIKRYNRQCETALLTAEALCVLAGIRCTDLLREAWTAMLFNHFHDIFDGAAVHDSYLNAHARAEESLHKAAAVQQEALGLLLQTAEDGETLVLINPLGFTRREPVIVALPEGATTLIDERGKATPLQRLDDRFVFIAEDIPAFSRKCYRISFGDIITAPDVHVSEDDECFTVETAGAVSRLLKHSGAIGTYFDKTLDRELVCHGMPKYLSHVPNSRADLALNVFHLIDEAPNLMSAWLINDHLREEHLLRGATVTLLDAGPVFARFRVRHAFRASTIEEDVIYYQHYPRVDFTARINWHERGSAQHGVPQLKVSFGTALRAPRARFEGPFFITERTPDGQEQPTQKWLDVHGEGFGAALLNDSKYGCDVLGGRMRLTLLRNPYGPDTDPDNGQHEVRFAFLPHQPEISNADLLRHGMAYNRPPVAARTTTPLTAHPANLRLKGAESVVCTALCPAKHPSRLLIRLFETSGHACKAKLSLGEGITAAEEVNFLEHPTGNPVRLTKGKTALTFHPFEVKTLLVECASLH